MSSVLAWKVFLILSGKGDVVWQRCSTYKDREARDWEIMDQVFYELYISMLYTFHAQKTEE